jgi:8-oxo-dGTP pyrophosphatase MutT (NUDIX family)
MQQLIEIVDGANVPTGKTADIDTINAAGLWHRGVHAIIYSEDGYVLVQKRAPKIIFHPGSLDISVGGGVDKGELPEDAMLREIHEELGLKVSREQLEYVGIRKYSHVWPHYYKITRCFIYTYLVKLPDHQMRLALQASEVAEARFISIRETKKLIKSGRIKSFGRLEPTYRYYKQLLAAVEHGPNGSASHTNFL